MGSVVATAAVLFAIGVLKSRWTRRGWLRSGVEILALGAFAGIAGYFFGTLLPILLGVPARELRARRLSPRGETIQPIPTRLDATNSAKRTAQRNPKLSGSASSRGATTNIA